MPETAPAISIIVPTYREGPNVEPLLERIAGALGPQGRPYEVLIVDDDSRDGTVETVGRLSGHLPVRVIVRTENRDLSLAALAGLARHAASISSSWMPT